VADVDAGISALNNPEVLRIIIEHGDMDRPSDLIKRLLMRPELLALGGKLGMKTLLRMFL
ncbi:MAG: NAD(P)/FAD-dependent oxidoreductase, partial [Methanocorpusculum sp.]|nr:NAD(P)/FAD-dependent oxidoreductase [Methanocorpusculum sp.]